jgi:hypothetical protein
MFVGMDVHKNYLQIAVLDEKGKILSNSRVDNNLIKVNEFFDSLHPRSNTKVVMESSGMGYNVYECLSNRHLDVRLSNPAKTRAIASAKIKSPSWRLIKSLEKGIGLYFDSSHFSCLYKFRRCIAIKDHGMICSIFLKKYSQRFTKVS